jgi:hypothetical protein
MHVPVLAAVVLLLSVSVVGCAASEDSGTASSGDTPSTDAPSTDAPSTDTGRADPGYDYVDYTDRLVRAAQRSHNYAGEHVQRDRGRIVLYGVGKPVPKVAAIIDDAPDELEVQWQSTPYTRSELDREARRVMQHHPRLHTGGPRTDATGLVFTTTDDDLIEAPDPQRALGSRYPVTIQRGPRPMPLMDEQ